MLTVTIPSRRPNPTGAPSLAAQMRIMNDLNSILNTHGPALLKPDALATWRRALTDGNVTFAQAARQLAALTSKAARLIARVPTMAGFEPDAHDGSDF